MKYRTDLAIESKEMLDDDNKKEGSKIPGLQVDEDQIEEGVKVVRIKIVDEEGSKAMGKPIGTYVTIEVRDLVDGEEERKKAASHAITSELSKMLDFHANMKVLIIGLGNDKVTPDSLGPNTVSKVKVTRHIFLQYDNLDQKIGCVSALIPGVMGTTGMETAELIKGAISIAKPEVVIAVDALAARSIERISTTIQMTDTGISPGAGTGNMRKDLTRQSLGTKVVAIGVPTVIDSSTLIMDTLSGFIKDEKGAQEHIETKGEPMIVTTSDIDQVIFDFSEVIANGINSAVHPGIYSS